MGDKISVCNEKKIAANGYFDVKKTYANLMDFIENSLLYDVAVNEYDEKTVDGKKDITAGIEAKKDVNDVFKIVLKMKVSFKGVDVHGEIDGRKIVVQNGEGSINMNGYTEVDWAANREKSPFASFLDNLYQRYVGNDEVAKVTKIADSDVNKIFTRFKTHFNSKLK